MSNRPIADVDTPDPWMMAVNDRFYLTFTCGNRVEIWMSHSMENFRNCQKTVAWKPAQGSPWSEDLWAPELHYLAGTWYIYFCAGQPGIGNRSHRTTLLRSRSPDPMDAQAWEFLGPLQGLPDHWHIDATVFFLPRTQKLCCCYSGWPLGDHSDTEQDLFLIELANPEAARPDTLRCISKAQLPWERPDGGRRGVNEGPTWLSLPGFEGIIYSANGSWTSDYQLGILQLVGDDPLQESSWRKRPTPLLVSDRARGGPFGPGHASFIPSPYRDGRVYCIYHATEREGEGWNNRKARVLLMGPEQFQPQAQSMCCALSAMGNWNAAAAGGTGGGRMPQNVFEQEYYAAQQKPQSTGLLDKFRRKLREF